MKDYGFEFHPVDNLIYKYTSYATALKIIQNNKLRFSSSHVFNDPFELHPGLIDFSFSKKELSYFLYNARTKIKARLREQIIKEQLKQPSAFENYMSEMIMKIKESCGICCFSSDYLNALLWSHYADSHKGVCLGFSIEPYHRDIHLITLKVRYADDVRPIKYFGSEGTMAIINWLFTKPNCWAYENEVRMCTTIGFGDIIFNKACLQEVHFGLRVTEKEQMELINELNSNGYQVDFFSKIQMKSGTFSLFNEPKLKV